MLERLLRLARARGAGPKGSMQDRSDYKSTWQQLARSADAAKTSVAGTADEEQFAITGAQTVDLLQKFVGVRPTDVILEVGCGVGRVGKFLAPICRQWIGTDISANMLRFARQRLQGLENVKLVELSGSALKEIPTASVDVVYCTIVFMHLFEWDRYRYVHDAHRVLRPGGRIFYDNMDIISPHGKMMFDHGLSLDPMARPAHLSMTSTGDELETYARWAGFTDIRVHRWADAWVGVAAIKAP
jgi:SAM-dependent methyltransferase